MKILLPGISCLFMMMITLPTICKGQVVAPMEWNNQDPRPVQGNYLARGFCRYTFDQSYRRGEFKVNVTFDKMLSSFNDFNSWERLASNPGYWYYSQSKWYLNAGQVKNIEFLAKWPISSGIERPSGQCIANGGTPTLTTAAPTQAPTTVDTTEAPSTTTTTPRTTTELAPRTTTQEQQPTCGVPVVYNGDKWRQGFNYVIRGECTLTFDRFVSRGALRLRVDFVTPILDFDDFNQMTPIRATGGRSYLGQSKWPFNENQEWKYGFHVTWSTGQTPPDAMCYTNVHCDDFDSVTPSLPERTTTLAPPPQTTTRVTSPPATTTQAAPTTTRAGTTQAVTTRAATTQAATTQAATTQAATTQAATTQAATTQAATTQAATTQQTTTIAGSTPSDSVFPTFNYANVMDLSMDFFAAQRSGALPDNRIPWRGDSALTDAGDNGEDLTGGYYDAGDHVKFNFPMASSMTLLAWGQYVFSDVYEEFQLGAEMRDTIKYGLDYLLKCWIPDNNNPVFYGQVGNGFLDHAFWGRPEEMTMQRPAYKLDKNRPGSDLAAETAAAFAAGSLIFRDSNSQYAATLIKVAEEIYKFAEDYRGIYSQSIQNAATFYSSSGYNDELMLGAVILHEATGKQAYLNKAISLFPNSTKEAWALSWDDKNVLAHLILYSMTNNTQYMAPVVNFMRRYRGDIGSDLRLVDGVLAWRSEWASLRYAANAAMVAVLAADAGIEVQANIDWAQSQIDYILGDNPDRFSYVIGFGNTFPLRPHHRSSSCPDLPATCNSQQLSSSGRNPQQLNGALVGGPDSNGNWADDRNDFQKNEVACDYNAGFTSALAGLTHFRGMLSN